MRSRTMDAQRDRIESLGRSVIQHGPLNDRIYLMKIHPEDGPGFPEKLKNLARDRGYSKVFAKIPEPVSREFMDAGFSVEATVPGMFQGRGSALFMGYYLKDWRREAGDADVEADVLLAARSKQGKKMSPGQGADQGETRLLDQSDAVQMAAVYARIFASYPFPVHDPAYLSTTMEHDVHYRGIFQGDSLVALASAEVDVDAGNAEMTDFATLPEYRGRGSAGILMGALESMLADMGSGTAYTIARATSYGMNITFAKNGYEYAGTLINNTNIAGGLESMNVWYKSLRGDGGGTAKKCG
ncbi:putative beta-lysine N-acetyltransferase [Desulfoplanes sp.]